MSWILGAIGGFILFLYGIVPTFQPSYFHRIYAAYGGIFIVMALLWGLTFEGVIPDMFDVIGATIACIGAATFAVICGLNLSQNAPYINPSNMLIVNARITIKFTTQIIVPETGNRKVLTGTLVQSPINLMSNYLGWLIMARKKLLNAKNLFLLLEQ
jgi:drug/metabolite transporter superfamily protein YnfA